MKLAVSPFHIDDISSLITHGADIILVGNSFFANRLTASFTNEELIDIVQTVKTLGKEVYIQLNLIVHNEHLEALDTYLDFVKSLDVDGIVFGDLAVYQLAKQKHMEQLLYYNPETLNTNTYDAIYWGKRGIKGLFIAKEITLEDISLFHQESPIECAIIGHGHLNMFHSRRPLIENFFKYRDEKYEAYVNNRNLRLVEEIRNDSYPVFQDEHGTHIYRDKAMESYREINQLEEHIDVFVIDAIFKDAVYLEETIKNYRLLLDTNNSKLATELSEQNQTDHDSGFLYKKTVYDKY